MSLIDYTNIENDAPAIANLWNERFGQVVNEINGKLDSSNLKDGAVTISKIATEVFSRFHPVGSIYIHAGDDTNPNALLGFGTWERFAEGRTLIGTGTSDEEYLPGSTGGSSRITLTVAQMPSHNHVQDAHNHNASYRGYNEGGGEAQGRVSLAPGNGTFFSRNGTDARQPHIHHTGGGEAFDNRQPYISVFMWKRVG